MTLTVNRQSETRLINALKNGDRMARVRREVKAGRNGRPVHGDGQVADDARATGAGVIAIAPR